MSLEFALRAGDYRPDGRGSFVAVSGPEALLQRALIRLSARRGCLPWLPELGSRLHMLRSARSDEWDVLAQAYVTEALAPEEDVRVETVSVTQPEPGRLHIEAILSAGGRRAAAEVTL